MSPAYAPLRDSKFVLGVGAMASYTVALGDGIARGDGAVGLDVELAEPAPPFRLAGPAQIGGHRMVLAELGDGGLHLAGEPLDKRPKIDRMAASFAPQSIVCSGNCDNTVRGVAKRVGLLGSVA